MTMQRTTNTTREVANLLKTLDRVAVTTHVGADGDAIGASAALVRLMRALGAEAVFCHAEEVPAYLRWLLPGEALRELPPDHDLLVVDTSRADRAGVPVPEAGALLNLDHHEDNPLYAQFNLLDPRAAASAEIVAGLYTELCVPFEKPAAEALYVGIRTDTGGFTFRNISPRAHQLVADLLRAGVVPAEVAERINRRGSIEQLRIVGVSLANAVRYGEVLISTVENSDYERTGATELDSKESIDQLRTVEGIDVVAHLREVPHGTKGSLRSETVDVGEIARRFGGGGHRLAAGYTTPRRPREAREELLAILKQAPVDLGGGR
ncbi:MAG: bifunctional oligoribonuclease/PAP phosphatase NrnA [Actinomycetota bacterium]|nr:bifunctional oligoribonuclease/PAP phosphatase NrnA [Actinomycetota bacterium]MDP9477256.1 bifunctional oligoribonuclease/PAP phosphatase NrnA [Actinomycetota bacterium]MDP9484456.1 bifunctional oligoribonuclease/PAP phosphatase NrnA [Actinomycetota bacterium]